MLFMKYGYTVSFMVSNILLYLSCLYEGRVSFTEPNIQNVPKDFDIEMPTVIGESQPSENGSSINSSKR